MDPKELTQQPPAITDCPYRDVMRAQVLYCGYSKISWLPGFAWKLEKSTSACICTTIFFFYRHLMIKVIFLSRIFSLIRKLWLLGRKESRDRMRKEAKVVRGYYRILRGRQGMGVKNDPLPPGGHAGFASEVLKWRNIWLSLLENMWARKTACNFVYHTHLRVYTIHHTPSYMHTHPTVLHGSP